MQALHTSMHRLQAAHRPDHHGDVIQVSADRLTDPKTNNPYYVAFVQRALEILERPAMPD